MLFNSKVIFRRRFRGLFLRQLDGDTDEFPEIRVLNVVLPEETRQLPVDLVLNDASLVTFVLAGSGRTSVGAQVRQERPDAELAARIRIEAALGGVGHGLEVVESAHRAGRLTNRAAEIIDDNACREGARLEIVQKAADLPDHVGEEQRGE